jgi:hypothetical protein
MPDVLAIDLDDQIGDWRFRLHCLDATPPKEKGIWSSFKATSLRGSKQAAYGRAATTICMSGSIRGCPDISKKILRLNLFKNCRRS